MATQYDWLALPADIDPLHYQALIVNGDYSEDEVNVILDFVRTYCPAHGLRVEKVA